MHPPAVGSEDGTYFAPRLDGDPNGLHANVHDLVCVCDGRSNNGHVTKGCTSCRAHKHDYKRQVVTTAPKEGCPEVGRSKIALRSRAHM